MHTFLILSIKNVPSEISHVAIIIEFLIFLLLSSFCPENCALVIYTFLSITLLLLDLEQITFFSTRIPFPMLGHITAQEIAMKFCLTILHIHVEGSMSQISFI